MRESSSRARARLSRPVTTSARRGRANTCMPSYLAPSSSRSRSAASSSRRRRCATRRSRSASSGSLAVWARGGPESSHDLDFGVRECDLVACAEALEGVGMRIEIPPEDWLVKAWLGEPGGAESVLVDLIYGASGLEITDEVLARADVLDVLAHRMPVMTATDILCTQAAEPARAAPRLHGHHRDGAGRPRAGRLGRRAHARGGLAVRPRVLHDGRGARHLPGARRRAGETPVETLAALRSVHEPRDACTGASSPSGWRSATGRGASRRGSSHPPHTRARGPTA